MTFLREVGQELFKMFLADLGLTAAILGLVGLVAVVVAADAVDPLAAGALLALGSLVVLAVSVLRAARR